MQLPSHTNALADQANAAGAAKHFAEGEEAARLTQLKEDRRARPTNAQLMDAMSYWTEDDLLAICRARRKCDPLLLARVVNAAIDKFLNEQIELEEADAKATEDGDPYDWPRDRARDDLNIHGHEAIDAQADAEFEEAQANRAKNDEACPCRHCQPRHVSLFDEVKS